MNLIVQDIPVRRGLNTVNIRRDSNPLGVMAEPIGTNMHAFFACPTGRMGDEIVKIMIEDSGTVVSYEGDIEYLNSFYMNGRFYHAFWVRDRPMALMPDAKESP